MKLSPQQIRDRMITGYLDGYRRHGIAMTTTEVERQVVEDCELIDRARSAGELSGGTPKAKAKPEAERVRPDVLAEAQRETNLTLKAHSDPVVRMRALHQNPQKVSERWGAAVARIARILQGRAKSSSLVVAVENGELGYLAVQFMDLYGHVKTKDAPPPPSGNDRNPFRGLSDRDASRKFMRLVEDICDRSTGVLGSWYVK